MVEMERKERPHVDKASLAEPAPKPGGQEISKAFFVAWIKCQRLSQVSIRHEKS